MTFKVKELMRRACPAPNPYFVFITDLFSDAAYAAIGDFNASIDDESCHGVFLFFSSKDKSNEASDNHQKNSKALDEQGPHIMGRRFCLRLAAKKLNDRIP
jgi:hypothetical protein